MPNATNYFVVTSPVKMPLFFAISGYLFVRRDFLQYFKKTFSALVVPWISLGFLPYLIRIPFRGIDFALTSLSRIISGEVIWFMPCFIISSFLFYVLLRVFKNNIYGLCLFVSVFFALGLILHSQNILDYAMANRALAVLPYFLFGFLYKQIEPKIKVLSPVQVLLLCILFILVYALLVIVTLFFYPEDCLDIHLNYFYSLPICLTMIFLGLSVLFVLSPQIDNYPKWILAIGKHSLVIYLCHPYAIAFSHRLFNVLSISLPIYVSLCLDVFVVCVLCVSFSIFLSKYVPFMVGFR